MGRESEGCAEYGLRSYDRRIEGKEDWEKVGRRWAEDRQNAECRYNSEENGQDGELKRRKNTGMTGEKRENPLSPSGSRLIHTRDVAVPCSRTPPRAGEGVCLNSTVFLGDHNSYGQKARAFYRFKSRGLFLVFFFFCKLCGCRLMVSSGHNLASSSHGLQPSSVDNSSVVGQSSGGPVIKSLRNARHL